MRFHHSNRTVGGTHPSEWHCPSGATARPAPSSHLAGWPPCCAAAAAGAGLAEGDSKGSGQDGEGLGSNP